MAYITNNEIRRCAEDKGISETVINELLDLHKQCNETRNDKRRLKNKIELEVQPEDLSRRGRVYPYTPATIRPRPQVQDVTSNGPSKDTRERTENAPDPQDLQEEDLEDQASRHTFDEGAGNSDERYRLYHFRNLHIVFASLTNDNTGRMVTTLIRRARARAWSSRDQLIMMRIFLIQTLSTRKTLKRL
jgi:hypothetical protein